MLTTVQSYNKMPLGFGIVVQILFEYINLKVPQGMLYGINGQGAEYLGTYTCFSLWRYLV